MTSIEWTKNADGSRGKAWNPLRGCSRVSAGCEHCYAERMAHRFSGPGMPYEGLTKKSKRGRIQWTGEVRLVPEKLSEPLRWRKPTKVFVNSMSDLFHEDVSFEYIDRVFAVMALTGRHVHQILTKRAERMEEYFSSNPRARVAALLYDASYGKGASDPIFGGKRSDGDRLRRSNMASEGTPREGRQAWGRVPQGGDGEPVQEATRGTHRQVRLFDDQRHDRLGAVPSAGPPGRLDTCPRQDPERPDDQSQRRGQRQQQHLKPGAGDTFTAKASCNRRAERKPEQTEGLQAPENQTVRKGRTRDEARSGGWGNGQKHRREIRDEAQGGVRDLLPADVETYLTWPLPNVWLLASAEDQPTFDARAEAILRCPAAVRGMSLEPLLGPIDLRQDWQRDFAEMGFEGGSDRATWAELLDWCIVGGESGPGANPCDLAWIRSIVAQCREAGTACFVKQLGSKPVDGSTIEIVSGGRVKYRRPAATRAEWESGVAAAPGYSIRPMPLKLKSTKGNDMSEWPEGLRVRQYPEARHG